MKSYQEQILESVDLEYADTDKFRTAIKDCFAIQRLEKEIENTYLDRTFTTSPVEDVIEYKDEIKSILAKYSIEP